MPGIRWIAGSAVVVAGLVAATISLSQPPAEEPIVPNPPVRWFKGNLHTHSLWSDGNDFPEMIADWYRRSGYQFLALSDHNILSEGEKWMDTAVLAKRGAIDGLARYRERYGDDWVELREVDARQEVRLKPLVEFRTLVEERGRFLLIQSEEITDHFGKLPVHVNAHNLKDTIKPQGGESVRETIANNLRAVESQSERVGQPMLAHLNHPNFGWGVTAEDMAAVLEERFFEVYNGHPGVNHLGDASHASVERMWDIANTIRLAEMKALPLYGLATDDSHNYYGDRGASPGRGWVMVRARRLTPEAIITALKTGEFYSSSGVTLRDVRYDGESKTLELAIEAAPDETYSTQFIGTLKSYDARREPVLDKEGNPLPVTQSYSDDVGRVLATANGPRASYKLTGDELYVRAVVYSNKPPVNPAFKNQVKQAWTQPVGWE
jgi:hypothetical protein